MVINGFLDGMLKKRLTLGMNDPGTSRNSATLKRHSSILMQILGDLSASSVRIMTFKDGIFVNYRQHQHNQYRESWAGASKRLFVIQESVYKHLMIEKQDFDYTHTQMIGSYCFVNTV